MDCAAMHGLAVSIDHHTGIATGYALSPSLASYTAYDPGGFRTLMARCAALYFGC